MLLAPSMWYSISIELNSSLISDNPCFFAKFGSTTPWSNCVYLLNCRLLWRNIWHGILVKLIFEYVKCQFVHISPTKFAVRGIMDCLRMELHDRGLEGIVCTTICPFFVRSFNLCILKHFPGSYPNDSEQRHSASFTLDSIHVNRTLLHTNCWCCTEREGVGIHANLARFGHNHKQVKKESTRKENILHSLFSLNMQRVARDFINFRYEDPDEETILSKADVVANGQGNGMVKAANKRVAHVRHRQVQKDLFELVSPIWWILIISTMLFLFVR